MEFVTPHKLSELSRSPIPEIFTINVRTNQAMIIAISCMLQSYLLLRSLPDDYDDDDAPVQGPLPKEPDEKLNPWAKKEESGIRKL